MDQQLSIEINRKFTYGHKRLLSSSWNFYRHHMTRVLQTILVDITCANFANYVYSFGTVFASHQYCKCYMATLQIYWWRKTSNAPPYIISITKGHQSSLSDAPISNQYIHTSSTISYLFKEQQSSGVHEWAINVDGLSLRDFLIPLMPESYPASPPTDGGSIQFNYIWPIFW